MKETNTYEKLIEMTEAFEKKEEELNSLLDSKYFVKGVSSEELFELFNVIDDYRRDIDCLEEQYIKVVLEEEPTVDNIQTVNKLISNFKYWADIFTLNTEEAIRGYNYYEIKADLFKSEKFIKLLHLEGVENFKTHSFYDLISFVSMNGLLLGGYYINLRVLANEIGMVEAELMDMVNSEMLTFELKGELASKLISTQYGLIKEFQDIVKEIDEVYELIEGNEGRDNIANFIFYKSYNTSPGFMERRVDLESLVKGSLNYLDDIVDKLYEGSDTIISKKDRTPLYH